MTAFPPFYSILI